MQREQILRGVQCLFWLAHPKLLIYAADSVLTFPHPLKKCALSLPLSIIFHTVARLWTPTDVSIHLHVCAFFFFFLTQVFTSFHICASLFSTSFCSFFFFYRPFPLSHLCVHLLHRPQLYSSAHFIRVSPCLFQFSSQSSRNVRLPTTHIPPYSPRIAVIMLILSTLGWCPLNVISSKISVFLSTNSQSTGSLTSNSHVPVFALLSPLVTVAVTEWKCSLQVSVA